MNKAKQALLVLGLSAASLSACSTYQMKYKNPTAQHGVKHTVKQNFFLWGHVGGSSIDLKQLCPTGVAEIASESSFVDGLLFGLTIGLYSPLSVEVHCESGTAYRVDDTNDGTHVTQITSLAASERS